MRTFLLLLSLILGAFTVEGQSYTKRLALVIGNSNYENGGSLPNPVNDANAIAQSLQSLGFEVMKYQNVTEKEMKQAINSFGLKLNGYEVGLFYYAGHGIQNKGMNYMIPVEADLHSEAQIEFDCVAADRVLAYMDAAQTKVNVIIMDACRNNPFERSWNRSANGNGLAMMNAPTGSLIAYATAPGKVASDGTGSNGLYTSALLKYLPDPKLTIEQVFKKVRTEVTEKSSGAQVPWETTSLTGDDFYFSTNTISKGTIMANEGIMARDNSSVSGNRNYTGASEGDKLKAKEQMTDGHNYYTENPAKAIELYSKAIQLNPYYDEAYYWRASVKYTLKQYREAIGDYSKAIEYNPRYEEAYYYRALSHYELGSIRESLPDFTKAIELNPDVASMHYWRGQARYKLNQYNEAIVDYTHTLEINKNDGYAYAGRANCYYMLAKYKEGRMDYNLAIELLPNEAYSYWYWRGLCSYNLNLTQEALNDFVLHLEKTPDDPFALLMMGHCYFVFSNYQQAVDYYTKAIQVKADYKDAYYWRANAFLNLNNKVESLRDITKAIQLDPENETYKTFKSEKFN